MALIELPKEELTVFAAYERLAVANARKQLISRSATSRVDAEAAKRRLADEYDAAQARGEVATFGKRSQPERLSPAPPSAKDIGLTRKQIHEARAVRDDRRWSERC